MVSRLTRACRQPDAFRVRLCASESSPVKGPGPQKRKKRAGHNPDQSSKVGRTNQQFFNKTNSDVSGVVQSEVTCSKYEKKVVSGLRDKFRINYGGGVECRPVGTPDRLLLRSCLPTS